MRRAHRSSSRMRINDFSTVRNFLSASSPPPPPNGFSNFPTLVSYKCFFHPPSSLIQFFRRIIISRSALLNGEMPLNCPGDTHVPSPRNSNLHNGFASDAAQDVFSLSLVVSSDHSTPLPVRVSSRHHLASNPQTRSDGS